MKRYSVILALGALTGGVSAACTGGGTPASCSEPTLGCGCDEGNCVAGLVCEAGQCVNAGAGTDTVGTIDGATGGVGSTGSGGGSGTEGPLSAPLILSFTTNVMSIGDGGFVSFSAELSDPDGLRDIVSATLSTPDLAGTYGELVDNGSGVFTLGLSWDEIHVVSPLNFVKNEDRAFVLTVTDTMDQAVAETLDLGLSCGAFDACDGLCVDITSVDEHCGACGDACPVVDGIGGCTAGACEPSLWGCLEPGDVTSCEDYCVAQGETCVEDGCGTATYILYDDMQMCTDGTAAVAQGTTCATAVNFTIGGGYPFARCCCTAVG
jgi:hypothetical protein